MGEYKVYKITNRANGKVYIGMTNNVVVRWSGNGTQYKPYHKENANRPFWNAIQKYGWEMFDKEVLLDGLEFEEAIEKEIETIASYNSTNKHIGYNVSPGGNGGRIYKEHPRGMKGKRQTEHQRKSHTAWASKEENNCMTNGQVVWGVTHDHPRGMKGKTHSEEYKEKLRSIRGSSHPASKKIKVVTANGETLIFGSLRECQNHFSINTVIYKMLKSGEPWVMPNCNMRKDVRLNLEKIVGYKFSYHSDDTEVTDGIKKPAAP